MKSALAKARNNWLISEDGKECCHGTATGQYLQNRLERAFLAGADFSSGRIEELEAEIERHKELMEGATLDYGYANGWSEEPILIKECKEKGHKRNDRSLGHFDNIAWCDECHYQYKYDSS